MKTPRFSGPFKWSALRQQLLSLREDIQSIQKVAGRNVTVDEHRGKGMVINARRDRAAAGAATGACCVGSDCSIQTADDCAAMGGTYQGDDTTCESNPCCPTTDVTITCSFSGVNPCCRFTVVEGWLQYDLSSFGSFSLPFDEDSGCWNLIIPGGLVAMHYPNWAACETPDDYYSDDLTVQVCCFIGDPANFSVAAYTPRGYVFSGSTSGRSNPTSASNDISCDSYPAHRGELGTATLSW